MRQECNSRGITLVEVLVGVSVLAVVLVAISLSITTYVDFRHQLLVEAKTAYLTEEGYEILRAVRDTGWNTVASLPLDTIMYLEVTPTTISATITPEIIDSTYTRQFVLRELYRNNQDDLVASTTPGATVDPEGRVVEITVSGPGNPVTFVSILSNVHAN